MWRRTLPLTIALALATAAAAAPPPQEKAVDKAHIDATVGACQDFYQHANGGWLAKNPIPGDYPVWGTGTVVSERNRDTVRSILEDAAKNTTAAKGSNDQKVGDYYASCMAEDKIEAAGVKPLEPVLARIEAIKDVKGLQDEIARLQASGVQVAFQSGSEQDFKDSTQVIAAVAQGGLGLPDRDYYTKTDDKSKEIREEYVKHVAKMLELLGEAPEKAAAGAKTIMELETKLANASMTRVDRRDPANIYHRMTAAQIKELTPNIAWPDYFKTVGLKSYGGRERRPAGVLQGDRRPAEERAARRLEGLPALAPGRFACRGAARQVRRAGLRLQGTHPARDEGAAPALEALRPGDGRGPRRGARPGLRAQGLPAPGQGARPGDGEEPPGRAQGRPHGAPLDGRRHAQGGAREARHLHQQDRLPRQVARLLRARRRPRSVRPQRAAGARASSTSATSTRSASPWTGPSGACRRRRSTPTTTRRSTRSSSRRGSSSRRSSIPTPTTPSTTAPWARSSATR